MSGSLSVAVTVQGDVVLRVGPVEAEDGELESISAHLDPRAADALAKCLTQAAVEGRMVKDLIAQVDAIDVSAEE